MTVGLEFIGEEPWLGNLQCRPLRRNWQWPTHVVNHWARRFATVRRCFALVPVALLSIWTADAGHAVGPVGVRLQPHLAIYDLVLKRAEDRLGLSRVNGRLA